MNVGPKQGCLAGWRTPPKGHRKGGGVEVQRGGIPRSARCKCCEGRGGQKKKYASLRICYASATIVSSRFGVITNRGLGPRNLSKVGVGSLILRVRRCQKRGFKAFAALPRAGGTVEGGSTILQLCKGAMSTSPGSRWPRKAVCSRWSAWGCGQKFSKKRNIKVAPSIRG